MGKKIVFVLVFVYSLVYGSEFEEIKLQYFKSYDYEYMHKYDEAIKVLTPLYQKYPKGYTLNLRFGWLFFLDKKYENALQYYKKASLISPYAIDPKLGLIRIYLALYDYEKARVSGFGIMKSDYYNYYANLYVIKALLGEKRYDTAREIIFKMLSIYPTDVLFLEQLATLYMATKSPYLESTFQDILILDPNNIFVKTNYLKIR